MRSIRALLPTLLVDTLGATIVYFILRPHYPQNSIWPVLGASLVPIASNVFNFIRRRSFDVVGLIVLLGMIIGTLPAIWGGSMRILLVRESFLTGVIGIVLIVSSFFMRKSIMYYIVHEVLTANETLPEEDFAVVWRSKAFQLECRTASIVWGVILVGEFCLRAFMAFRLDVGFVIAVVPVLFTSLLLCAGAATAIWLRAALTRALRGAQPQREGDG
jgi:hypothetical protein